MSDRPEGPKPGSPEYDWLYGGSGAPEDDSTQVIPQDGSRAGGDTRPRPAAGPPPGSAQEQSPEETRVLPTTQPHRPPPPPQAPGRGPGGPPPGGPGGPGGGGGRRFGFGLRRPRFRPFRWLKWIVLAWLVFLLVVPFIALQKISTVDAMPDGDRPDEQDGTTYLIVGSDSREDLSKEERKELGTGNASGNRTDTIMLLHIGSGPNLLMSIPRDSIVEIPGHGQSKINAATAFGGEKLLVRTIEQNTGIRIDHYVEIGFGGFVDVVDAVGGIEICPEKKMDDKDANLHIEKGCQEADGKTALGYARSRKTDPQYGDITRARHQREVVSAVGSEAVSPWTVLNPIRYWRVSMAAADTLRVSEDTGAWALARFGWAMTRVNGDDGLTCGVPISDLAVHWDPERSKEMFQHIIDDDTEGIPDGLCTKTGLRE